MAGEFLTFEETASALGVSIRHARRLADSGAVNRIARGLVDRDSVDRYLYSQRQGRTRSWAEHTAWGAVALLSGREAGWLGATQASRLRATLRELDDADDLLTRMRDRARVHTYLAHPAAHSRLRELIIPSDYGLVGLADASAAQVDGYLPEADLDTVVHDHAPRAERVEPSCCAPPCSTSTRSANSSPRRPSRPSMRPPAPTPACVGSAGGHWPSGWNPSASTRGMVGGLTTWRRPRKWKASLTGRVGRLVRAHRADAGRPRQTRHHNAEIFGSAARGDEHEGSDLDLLVDLAPGTDLFDLVHIKAELEEVLGTGRPHPPRRVEGACSRRGREGPGAAVSRTDDDRLDDIANAIAAIHAHLEHGPSRWRS